MRLPSIEDCLGCSDADAIYQGSSHRPNSPRIKNRLIQKRLSVHQCLGPIHQDYFKDEDEE